MTDLRTALERLLRGELQPSATALPVERLAHALGALPEHRSELSTCIGLFADGLTGGLLYRTHPELVLERLEAVVPALDEADRFELLRAWTEMRPISSEHLPRYLRLSLDALGFQRGGDGRAVAAAWSISRHRDVYRWSDAMRYLTALQMGEVSALFAERGITGEGGHPWDIFQQVVGYRATVIVTPRQSPAVRAEVESMQRHDWLDMPWMFGGPDATFTIDEIEEDSSPQNMDDGGRIARSLVLQRSPTTDFFAKSFAWHPRQTTAHVIEVAAAHGFDVLPPAQADRYPRRLERHELDPEARALQGRALRAMSAIDPAVLPVDVALVFHAHEEGPRAVLELSVGNTFGSDGKKYLVQVALGDPEAIFATLREHARSIAPATLPLLLAKLFSLSPELRVHSPDGPLLVVSAAEVALWDPDSPREPADRAAAGAQASELPQALLGSWRGQVTPDEYEAYQPMTLEISGDGAHVRALADTPMLGVVDLVGTFADGRVALRHSDPHQSYAVELVWDPEQRKLAGRWRHYTQGGRVSLERDRVARDVSAADLLAELMGSWVPRVGLDLEALRFPGERDLLHALFDDEHFRMAYIEAAAHRAVGTEAMQLDALVGRGATRLTPAMLPSAFRALDAAREALGFRDEVELWVQNDFTLNAFVAVEAGNIAIHFTSGLLEVLTEVELEAAIGHELGHVLFGAHDLAIRLRGAQMSGESHLRYFALRRLQELSADRLSLVACADTRAVFVVQTMLRTGIRRRDLFGGVDALIENARTEIASLRARPRGRIGLDSHPYSSLRTVALDVFARTAAFRSLRPDAPPPSVPLDDERARIELEALAGLLEAPTASEPAADASPAIARFRALAALRLIEADQTITVRELAALERLDPTLRAELREVVGWTHERRDVEIVGLARDVNRALAVPERERLLGELVRVVRADNVVQFAETSIVVELGSLLQVDTNSFRKTVDELYRGSR